MANIEYSQSDENHTLEYFGDDECIILQVFKDAPLFFCLWSPLQGAYSAFDRIRPLGFVPKASSSGQVESNGITYETNNRRETFRKVLDLGIDNIDYFRLGPEYDCFVIQRSPMGEGYCCGMGSSLERVRYLGTALTLTASRAIIMQYQVMHARLLNSY